MATTVNQVTVLNVLHNLLGHRVNPGGTDDDLKRFVQASFDYCWRYYNWAFSLKSATIAADGLLPLDMDIGGYRNFGSLTETKLENTILAGNTSSAVVWDSTLNRLKLTPAVAGSVVYQPTPPTLGTDAAGTAPFPSSQVVAIGAAIYAKQAENPTRADITQEWDLFHTELDRLAGRAYNAISRRPMSYHDKLGTFVGDVG